MDQAGLLGWDVFLFLFFLKIVLKITPTQTLFTLGVPFACAMFPGVVDRLYCPTACGVSYLPRWRAMLIVFATS